MSRCVTHALSAISAGERHPHCGRGATSAQTSPMPTMTTSTARVRRLRIDIGSLHFVMRHRKCDALRRGERKRFSRAGFRREEAVPTLRAPAGGARLSVAAACVGAPSRPIADRLNAQDGKRGRPDVGTGILGTTRPGIRGLS
jgi:hypothetical protein